MVDAGVIQSSSQNRAPRGQDERGRSVSGGLRAQRSLSAPLSVSPLHSHRHHRQQGGGTAQQAAPKACSNSLSKGSGAMKTPTKSSQRHMDDDAASPFCELAGARCKRSADRFPRPPRQPHPRSTAATSNGRLPKQGRSYATTPTKKHADKKAADDRRFPSWGMRTIQDENSGRMKEIRSAVKRLNLAVQQKS